MSISSALIALCGGLEGVLSRGNLAEQEEALERLGELLGVEMGRRLRNVREFSEALAVLETEVDEDKEKLRRHQTRDYENDYYDDEYEDDRDFDYCEQERTRWEDEEDAAFQAAQQQGFEENNDNEEDDDE